MKGEDSEEVEIDLGDSSDPDEFDNGEEPQMLWKAPPALEEEENIHTSTLVEISDTKPLINVRDPRGINDCLKVLPSYALALLNIVLWTICAIVTCSEIAGNKITQNYWHVKLRNYLNGAA